MSQTAIVTDSLGYVQTRGSVFTIPHRICLLDTEYADANLTADTMFKVLDQSGNRSTFELPNLLAPAAADVEAILEKAAAHGRDIVAILCSSTLSPVYQSVIAAKKRMTSTSIRIVDSHSVSLGQGFLVDEAVDAGRPKCECRPNYQERHR